MEDGIGVAEVIRQLRGDLSLAQWQGEDKDPQFELGPIELEFAVVVDSSRGSGATAKLWVVDVAAHSRRSSQVTHRIKLVLQPIDARSGEAQRISDREAVPPPRTS